MQRQNLELKVPKEKLANHLLKTKHISTAHRSAMINKAKVKDWIISADKRKQKDIDN